MVKIVEKEKSEVKDNEQQQERNEELKRLMHGHTQVQNDSGESFGTKEQPNVQLEYKEKLEPNIEGKLEEGELEPRDDENQASQKEDVLLMRD